MPAQSTLFKSNRSQAVRIPKELAFPENVTKVFVRKVGKSVTITPVDALWDDFFAQPGIDIEEPEDLPVQDREGF
jgi:antitoxin VapB